MTLKQRIGAFIEVGRFLDRHFSLKFREEERALHEGLNNLVETAYTYNRWFIPDFTNESLKNIGRFLSEEELVPFTFKVREKPEKTVAVICAGNIPMVAFHDIMCVLLSGNIALIKLSGDDKILLPFFLRLLAHYEPAIERHVLFAEGRLGKFDAVIATGSDNTASHLHYYFGKYPNIIRKSRTSVAVLTGKETTDELKALGRDIFLYFGLGCRNVSKLLVPEGYSFNLFFESIIDFGYVVNYKKYGNNYDYHRAIYLLEQIPFLDNNFLMLRESVDLHSPVGVLYYQSYKDKNEVSDYLKRNEDHIQCVVGEGYVPPGYSQQPVITDFADRIDTLEFLVNL